MELDFPWEIQLSSDDFQRHSVSLGQNLSMKGQLERGNFHAPSKTQENMQLDQNQIHAVKFLQGQKLAKITQEWHANKNDTKVAELGTFYS